MSAAPEMGSRSYLSRSDRDALHQQMLELCAEHRPLTLRQLYYLLVSAGSIAKTQSGYRRVMRQLRTLRHSGRIAWGVVIDTSRAYYGTDSHRGLAELLAEQARVYRRSLWEDVSERVEVWCESESIAGPISRVTREWDARCYPVSGYTSDGFVYEAAEEMAATDRPTVVYYYGDYDPSGEGISRDLERKLRDGLRVFGGDPDSLHFVRAAVTEEQVRLLDLPTRPAKASDPRTARWTGAGTVEIEAIPPAILRQHVEDCIRQHLDEEAVERLRVIEAEERATLARLAGIDE